MAASKEAGFNGRRLKNLEVGYITAGTIRCTTERVVSWPEETRKKAEPLPR